MYEDKDILRSAVGFVAEELSKKTGDEWKAQDHPTNERALFLTRADGAQLFANLYHKDTSRLVFVASWPEGWRNVYPAPKNLECSVWRDRKPSQVAGDIARKILPTFDEERARILAALGRDNDAVRARLVAVGVIADAYHPDAVYRADAGTSEDNSGRVEWYSTRVTPTPEAWVAYAGDSVKLTVDGLTVPQAVSLLRALGVIAD